MDESFKKAMEAMNTPAMKRIAETLASIKTIEAPELSIPHFKLPPSKEETNNYQSASILMRRLADSIAQWRSQLPEGEQPAIIAILHGGIQIQVNRLAQESFHGIRIDGTLNGSPCMMLAHQSTVQMLCYIEVVEKPEFKRKIGFIIDGEESEV